jgi:NTP pyrophosphatase (non-canonical NTP hydrolase)
MPKTIREWQKEVHDNSVKHGFWEGKGWSDVPEKLCLIHSEVSEALEAFRKGDNVNFAEELADTAIRVFDLAEHFGIDLDSEIGEKHAVNLKRPYKHNKLI